MSRPLGRDLSESFSDFLTGAARLLAGLGGLVTLIATGLLVFTYVRLAGDAGSAAAARDAINNIDILSKVLAVSVIAVGVGTSFLFWGEELLSFLLVVGGALLYFAPLLVPMIAANTTQSPAAGKALEALQQGGIILGSIAIVVTVVDIVRRVRERAVKGVKAENFKFGKGIKEDAEKNNVFMGKCWQLPFCRKFVRERCPIYHSGRTCWKEQTGCMCDEQIIKSAMDNKPIPKDALLAAQMIPRNNRLTPDQKRERCHNCVIYNEHQRHKYKLFLPVTLVGIVALYLLFRQPLLAGATDLVGRINGAVSGFTLGAAGQAKVPPFFVEMLVGVFVLVLISYSLKLLEFAIFKLKI